MHVTDRSKTVVMLIDWDNLQICHSRDAPGTELDLQALIALAQSYGTLVSARAYAEWNLLSERLAVYKAGIEPVFAPVMRPEGSPREGKSLADTVMVADGVDLLWTVAPDVFVLATSDKDMIPLARIAKQRGAAVVVLGSDLTAIPLVEMSNVFITYRQLLRELDRVSELEAPVGRAPARERRLRESRRPNSEPYGGGLGTNSGFGGQIGAGNQLGAGGRGGPRPVGTFNAPPAPPTPLPAPSAPRRRYPEPTPVPLPTALEPERASVAIVPSASPAPVAEPLADPLGIGNGDVTPRRRRRRGGRGRRTGIGGLGDGELQGDSLHDGVDDLDEVEADDDDQAPAVAAASSSPDDIDNAVLQLLASRDREQLPSAAAEAASLAEEPATSTVTPEPAVVEEAPPAPEPYAPRRRAVRTSFSSFGPPEINFRPAAPAPSEPEPPAAIITTVPETTDEPSASSAAAWAPAEPAAESASAVVAEGLAPDASVSEAFAAEPIPMSAAADAPESFDTAGAVDNGADSAKESVAESAPVASSRPARSSRSGRTGGTRRTRGSSSGTAAAATSTTAAASEAGSADEGSGDAPRAPRRRRTRRPASPAAEGPASEGLTSESPSEAIVSEASV
jgi:hypothetical protein